MLFCNFALLQASDTGSELYISDSDLDADDLIIQQSQASKPNEFKQFMQHKVQKRYEKKYKVEIEEGTLGEFIQAVRKIKHEIQKAQYAELYEVEKSNYTNMRCDLLSIIKQSEDLKTNSMMSMDEKIKQILKIGGSSWSEAIIYFQIGLRKNLRENPVTASAEAVEQSINSMISICTEELEDLDATYPFFAKKMHRVIAAEKCEENNSYTLNDID